MTIFFLITYFQFFYFIGYFNPTFLKFGYFIKEDFDLNSFNKMI